MMADYYAHLYFDDPKAASVDEDDDFDPDKVAEALGRDEDWEDLK